MILTINFEKLNDIMQAFYTITGIKIIIFDTEHNIIHSYPARDCAFCEMMKAIPKTAKKCAENDLGFFNDCRKSGKLVLCTCHAGLVEGCAPLKQNNEVIAYIMFGQISDLPTKETLSQNIRDICRDYGLDEKEFLKATKSIKLKNYESIMAAAKIFEACISYIILNEMLISEQDKTIMECERYISQNLDSVNVDGLCKYLNISRTRLYNTFRKKTGQGVASFIRNKQLEEAKKLLSQTNLSVGEVSSKCGFTDYNYFSRVFKKKYGVTAKSQKQKL